jgi:polysaccharide export outer membrane protein
MTSTRLALVLVAAALALGHARSDLRAQSAGEPAPRPAEEDHAYRVGPGDVLEVEVYDDPDLSGLFTIQYGGEISFPLLGDVAVDGLTLREVRERLTALLAKDYLVDPQVAVRIKEHRSQWVTLTGEVARPGKYFLQGSKTLLELLTEAGGFTTHASGEVIVSRPPGASLIPEDDGGPDETIKVFLTPEQPPSQQKEALALPLRNGDIVTATATQFFYVSGEVKNPGSFALTPGLTVLKAVSVAGGLSKFGSKGKVEILRKLGSGDTRIIKVDLGDIEDGRKPDVPLQAEDIIKVGKRVF